MDEEAKARTAKAAKLAGSAVMLRAGRIPAKDRPTAHQINKLTRDFVLRLTPTGWLELAKVAGVNEPSTQTMMLVVDFVETAAAQYDVPKNETAAQRKAREAAIFEGLDR